MSRMPPATVTPAERLRPRLADALPLLGPALLWCTLHGLLALLFFGAPLLDSVGRLASSLRPVLLVGGIVQALFLGLLTFVATLPLILLGRRYALALPVMVALGVALLGVDALVLSSLGFHINGLVLAVAMQPRALAETGLAPHELALLGAATLGVLALDVWAGVHFLRRVPRPRHVARLIAILVLVTAVERLTSAWLVFAHGGAVLHAATTLPLQPPVRMNTLLTRLTDRPPASGLRLGVSPEAGVPASTIDPASVRFTRRPDIVLILVESLRDDFFRPDVMPHLWRRAEHGTRFLHHHSAASSTDYSLFSLFFGLEAQRRDAVVGAGRSPLLFPALRENGYRQAFFAASSVDWMGLKDTVFRDVHGGLRTDYEGRSHLRDTAMVKDALDMARTTPKDTPLFTFVFFAGTHFDYDYPPRSAVFTPAWDGKGGLATARVPAEHLKARAWNSAYEVDTKVEELLSQWEATRGTRPLVIFTGDHGEEFREHGRVGHASDVTELQLHVPMLVFDEKLPTGQVEAVTGHIDLVPTLFDLLGDTHSPEQLGDGIPMSRPDPRRYLLTTIGWEARYALIGRDLKVRFGAGLPGTELSDLWDRPLPDAQERFAAEAPRILRRLRGGGAQTEAEPPSPPATATQPPR
ncbi:sulfatase-like hydrolase/transferase [Myxococcus sp. CA056]|uniref:sulfatase-like hydrolase/transferase n=2 Tax=unclassified Myxococcus TaxID=2648731 RepID=UPI00157B7BD0|nr:sulfatase-like hydrolase/transferase [Myxococcus sp. CA033]NTX12132.1 sulfatase-like hydrolase/transferase [Myxococcus sp. CA056]NTX33147.1 sulfatase-like hydrolase/transferase [Myxococcus sp. CA033]NTX56103.1 sulfatase-like hydrolase/transferase [Myxococcus sp. CA039A]